MNETPVTSFIMRRLVDEMRSKNLTIVVFRDRRRGHLRYLLSNGKRVHSQTVQAMKDRGILEQFEPADETHTQNEAHYRLKVDQ